MHTLKVIKLGEGGGEVKLLNAGELILRHLEKSGRAIVLPRRIVLEFYKGPDDSPGVGTSPAMTISEW